MDNSKTFMVHLLAFDRKESFRPVTIPDEKMLTFLLTLDKEVILDSIFYYGQNDFQSQQMPSVSAGDVIFLDDEIFMIMAFGFKKITPLEYAQYVKMSPDDRYKVPMDILPK